MTTQDKINIMQAFEDGADIEASLYEGNDWMQTISPCWDWDNWVYRVKPKERTKLWFWVLKKHSGCFVISSMVSEEHAAEYPSLYIERLNMLGFKYEEQ